jgi:hypothetical protein
MPNIADYKLADRRIIRLIGAPDTSIEDTRVARQAFRLPQETVLEDLGRITARSMDLVFTLPDRPHAVVTDEAAVLGFVADPRGTPEHLTFRVLVNDVEVLELGFATRSRRTLLEIIEGGRLRVGENMIRFSVTVHEGWSTEDTIEVGNVVLWFQRSI